MGTQVNVGDHIKIKIQIITCYQVLMITYSPVWSNVRRTTRPPTILSFCGFRSLAAPCSHNSSPIGRVLQPQKNFIEQKSLNAPVYTPPRGCPRFVNWDSLYPLVILMQTNVFVLGKSCCSNWLQALQALQGFTRGSLTLGSSEGFN